MNEQELTDWVHQLSVQAVSGDIASQQTLLRCLITRDAALKPFYELLDQLRPNSIVSLTSLPCLPSMVEANQITLINIIADPSTILPIRIRFSPDDLYNCLLFLALQLSRRIFLRIRLTFSSSQHILIERHQNSAFILLPSEFHHQFSFPLILSQFMYDQSKHHDHISPHALDRIMTVILTPFTSSCPRYTFLSPWLPSNLFEDTDDVHQIAFSVQYICQHLKELRFFEPYHPDALTNSSHYIIFLVRLQLISNFMFPKICYICFMVLSGQSPALSPEFAVNALRLCLGGLQEMWTSLISLEQAQELCSAAADGNYHPAVTLSSSPSSHDRLVLIRLIATSVTFRMMKSLHNETAEVVSLLKKIITSQGVEGNSSVGRSSLSALIEECEFVSHFSSSAFLTQHCQSSVTLESVQTRWRKIIAEYLRAGDSNYLNSEDVEDINLRMNDLGSRQLN